MKTTKNFTYLQCKKLCDALAKKYNGASICVGYATNYNQTLFLHVDDDCEDFKSWDELQNRCLELLK